MNIQDVRLPNPVTTPCTWWLQEYVQKYLQDVSITHGHQNTTDIICSPGHFLIKETTLHLISLGADGLNIDDIPIEEIPYEILSRGMTDPNIYASFLPSIGRYILYLWLIRAFIDTGHKEWNLSKIFLGIQHNEKDPIVYPKPNCSVIVLEWPWVTEFLILSACLLEPDLDVIPAFWQGGNRKDVIKHPKWQQMRTVLLETIPFLPYRLKHFSSENSWGVIAEAQGEALYPKLIFLMATLEESIRRTIETIITPVWKKMRSQGDLRAEQIDRALETRINWQAAHWTEAFTEDQKLHTTAMRMAFIRDWCVPQQKTEMNQLNKNIAKIFKRRSGYGPGNIGRVIKQLDQQAQDITKSLIFDLKEILKVAWPLTGKSKQNVKNLSNLKNITTRHINFAWDDVKGNERLDLCSKICAEYLEDITKKRYALKPIKRFLKKTFSK